MRKTARIGMCAAALLFAAPPAAFAAGGGVPEYVATAVGVMGLLLAVVLLIDVLQLRQVAEGSAIGESATLVVAAAICLAGTMLSSWVARFVPDADAVEQTRLAADLFALASTALFAVYFFRVRRSLQRFIKSALAAYTASADADEITAVVEVGAALDAEPQAGDVPAGEHGGA